MTIFLLFLSMFYIGSSVGLSLFVGFDLEMAIKYRRPIHLAHVLGTIYCFWIVIPVACFTWIGNRIVPLLVKGFKKLTSTNVYTFKD